MKVALVVTSSNGYYDLLDGFQYFFKRNWPDCPYEIHYCLENFRKLDLDGFLHFNKGNTSWSSRLIRTIKKIDADFLILMCEDYFIFDKINNSEISFILDLLIDYKLDTISWSPTEKTGVRNKNLVSNEDYKLNQTLRGLTYKYHIVAHGFYRKQSLLEILRENENIWEFENFGSFRTNLFQQIKIGRYIVKNNPFKYLPPGILLKGILIEEAQKILHINGYSLNWTNKISLKRDILYRVKSKYLYWLKNIKNIKKPAKINP